jgi:hypothetical protein
MNHQHRGERAEPVASEMPSPRVSRRSVLRGAAGAGAVGLAAVGGGAAITGTAAASIRPEDPAPAADGPVMVYLRDAKTGEMDVFAGTGQVSLRDPALAGQLLRAIQ